MEEKKVTRKKFILTSMLGTLGLVIGELVRKSPDIEVVTETEEMTNKKYGMLIDLNRCIGCNACTIACKQENNTPPNVQYNVVIEEEVGVFPNIGKNFLPRICMHCDNPPCVKVCPVAATKKLSNGIVDIDYETCIGCRYCMTACPYGARSFDFGENYYDEPNSFEASAYNEYGEIFKRKQGQSPIGNVRKCHYCSHRLEVGKLPACVDACLGKARIFGDLNNPESEVSKRSEEAWALKGELGTKPRTLYIGKRRD